MSGVLVVDSSMLAKHKNAQPKTPFFLSLHTHIYTCVFVCVEPLYLFYKPQNKQKGVGTGPPVGVGIGSLLVTPEINGEIGAMCAESDLAGVEQHNKT